MKEVPDSHQTRINEHAEVAPSVGSANLSLIGNRLRGVGSPAVIPGQLPLIAAIPGEVARTVGGSIASTFVDASSTEVDATGGSATFPHSAAEHSQDSVLTWPANLSVRLPVSAGAVFHPSTLREARRDILRGCAPVQRYDREAVTYFLCIDATSKIEAEQRLQSLGSKLVERLCGLSFTWDLALTPVEVASEEV